MPWISPFQISKYSNSSSNIKYNWTCRIKRWFFWTRFCLEDLFAHEDTIDPHSRKRVRIEDIDDEDEVRFVSVPKATEESLKSKEKKKGTPKAKSKPVSNEPTAPHKATKQLMNEAKISLTLEQICEHATGFTAELRTVLVKPRKPRVK